MNVVDIDHLPDAVVVVDERLQLVAANERCAELFGVPVEPLLGTVPLALVHPDDLPIVSAAHVALQGKSRGTAIEFRVRAHDAWRMVECIGATHESPSGRLSVLSLRDLTERRRWEVAAGDDEAFRTIVAQSSTWLAVVDTDGVITSSSWAATRLLGWDLEDVEGVRLVDLLAFPDRPAARLSLSAASATSATTRFEASARTAAGGEVPFQFEVVNLLEDPAVGALVVSGSDVSDRRRAQEHLEFLATHDPLTGLANRAALTDVLESLIASTEPGSLSVLFIDLDGFKPVNDLHGHEAGDEVLRVLARRLTSAVRPGDLVARFGGDEFVIVCAGSTNPAATAARVEAAVSAPVALSDVTVSVGASIGWVSSDGATSASDLIAAADASMYAVKSRRHGADPDVSLSLAQRRTVAESLGATLGASVPCAPAGMEVVFSPVVDLSSGHLLALAASLRWDHPTLGMLTPAQFSPVAVSAGLDVPLGRWVLSSALDCLAELGDVIPAVLVDLSCDHLALPGLASEVRGELEGRGLSSRSLWVGVSSTALAERRSDAVTDRLAALRGEGVAVAAAEFGAAQVSLASLASDPFDVVRIDAAFTSMLASSSTAAAVVAAVVAMAHATGRVVLAEGVTSASEHEALVAAGVDCAQGPFYGAAARAIDLDVVAAAAGGTP